MSRGPTVLFRMTLSCVSTIVLSCPCLFGNSIYFDICAWWQFRGGGWFDVALSVWWQQGALSSFTPASSHPVQSCSHLPLAAWFECQSILTSQQTLNVIWAASCLFASWWLDFVLSVEPVSKLTSWAGKSEHSPHPLTLVKFICAHFDVTKQTSLFVKCICYYFWYCIFLHISEHLFTLSCQDSPKFSQKTDLISMKTKTLLVQMCAKIHSCLHVVALCNLYGLILWIFRF